MVEKAGHVSYSKIISFPLRIFHDVAEIECKAKNPVFNYGFPGGTVEGLVQNEQQT